MQVSQTTELRSVGITELRNQLSAADYELFRRAVVMKCMISNATWSNWTKGKCTPEAKYQPIIDTVAAQFGMMVFAREGGNQ